MIRAFSGACFLVCSVAWSMAQEDISPLTSNPYSQEDTSAEVAAAKERGATSAMKDIEHGILRILSAGFPTPSAPRIERETGYLIKDINTCGASSAFWAELTAYNNVMRDWHAKKRAHRPRNERSASNQSMKLTAGSSAINF